MSGAGGISGDQRIPYHNPQNTVTTKATSSRPMPLYSQDQCNTLMDIRAALQDYFVNGFPVPTPSQLNAWQGLLQAPMPQTPDIQNIQAALTTMATDLQTPGSMQDSLGQAKAATDAIGNIIFNPNNPQNFSVTLTAYLETIDAQLGEVKNDYLGDNSDWQKHLNGAIEHLKDLMQAVTPDSDIYAPLGDILAAAQKFHSNPSAGTLNALTQEQDLLEQIIPTPN